MDRLTIEQHEDPHPMGAEATSCNANGRVLIVDDEENLRITTAAILEQDGYEVETAASGNEAIALLEDAEFDLILTDLHMAGGDGLSVLTEIKRRAPLTISVVLTGFASVESAIAALQKGAYDFLVKPCDIEEMKHTVRRGIEHRRLMLAEQQARTNLENLNRELERRVEERTAELTQLNEELAAANRAKDIFLATLSHELRTPLTPVLGWINLLKTGNLDEKGVAQALETIERNALLQSRLIDDLLDISRIATGKLRFEPQPIDLNKIVEAAVETVNASAAMRKVSLQLALSDEPPTVMGEPERLQQIVLNLLSNAVKFTESGGRVSLHTEVDGQEVRLRVEDTGVGIAPDFLPHVFDRFRQADGSTTRRYGGLGLGLAIVDALAKVHGGRVIAESEGIGKGSRFTLVLPYSAQPQKAGTARQSATARDINHSVLLVDDSPDTLELLRTFFEQKGSHVMAVTSAAEALDVATRYPPAIILSDIGLPDIDGYELLMKLRRLPGLEKTPAIAITGYAMDEDRERAENAGFTAHVAKPIDMEQLFALIQTLTS
jgi:signal transduction histidine kinase